MFQRNQSSDGNTSFLPEDYLARITERRTNIISLSLFAIVLFGVVGAFFVTNRQWSTVKEQQESINVRYTQAAQQIEQLKTLESQKESMLAKAELTTALIEKAPRSLLLADLINRMPDKLALLEFSLTSKRIDAPRPKAAAAQPRSMGGARGRPPAPDPKEKEAAPQAPRFQTTLVLVGVAPGHEDVSQYLAQLQASPLLRDVDLKFSEFTMLKNVELIKFRIEASLNDDADARRIEPLTADRADPFGGQNNSVAGAREER